MICVQKCFNIEFLWPSVPYYTAQHSDTAGRVLIMFDTVIKNLMNNINNNINLLLRDYSVIFFIL